MTHIPKQTPSSSPPYLKDGHDGNQIPTAFAGVDPHSGQVVAWVNTQQPSLLPTAASGVPASVPVSPLPSVAASPPSRRASLSLPVVLLCGLWGVLGLLAFHAFTGGNAQSLRAENEQLRTQLQQIRGCIHGY
ncbi:MAG: hypothetical protein AAFX78_19200 [Cyanobacteria bacterium J06638_20]